MRKKLLIFFAVLAVFLYLGQSYIWAAGEEGLTGVDLTVEGIFNIITGLACWLSRVAVAVMIIFIVLAGLRFMNARGDAGKWTTAKKNFNQVLSGTLVIMGVYVIIATVANAVGANFSFIPLVC